MTSYSKISTMCQDVFAKNEALPKAVTLQLLDLSEELGESSELGDQVIEQGGVPMMVTIMKRDLKSASTAMKVLLPLLSRPRGLSALHPIRLDLFSSLYEDLYSTFPAIVTLALRLLCILVEYYNDSFDLTARAAKQSSEKHTEPEYGVLVRKLTSKMEDQTKAAILVLSSLVAKSVASVATDAFLGTLKRLDIVNAIATARTGLGGALQAELDSLQTLCTSEGDATKTMEKTNWQSDRMATESFRMNSADLAAKVTALTGIAELAGVSSPEGAMMQVLTQHLKQMEEKLHAMNREQRDAAALAVAKQQAAMDAQLQAQKDLYENKLAELQKNMELGSTEKKDAELALQLEELKANQATLMLEYQKNQTEIEEQNYLRQHKQLWLFYQCIQLKLNELLLGYKVLASGLVQADDQGSKTQRTISTAIMIAGDLIPFPGATTAAAAINATLRIYRLRKTEKKVPHASSIAVSVGAMEQISEHAARILALRYEAQISALQDDGAKLLGECAVRRMMEAMRAGCLDSLTTTDNELVIKQLVDVIVQVEKRQGILALKHMKIPTRANSAKWHEQAIFKKPGIRTADGECFHLHEETDVAAYGYRFGTKEEAKSLGYVQSAERKSTSLELLSQKSVFFCTLPRSSSSFSGPLSPRGSTSPVSPRASSSSLAPTTPKSVFSPPPPPYQSPASPQQERTELEDLRKLVVAQQAAMEAMQTRMERMEALLLAMSAKVFPK